MPEVIPVKEDQKAQYQPWNWGIVVLSVFGLMLFSVSMLTIHFIT